MNMITEQIKPSFSWDDYDTILLDMDGTLLDKHFDDTFWGKYVPQKFGEKNNLPYEEAHKEAFKHFRAASGSFAWTDMEYWSRTFGLNIFDLQHELAHLIQELPGTLDFLRFLQEQNKEVILVTNSHSKGLALKFAYSSIEDYFTDVTCATELGASKEEDHFWDNFADHFNIDKNRTLFIDDNHKVLSIAEQYGIAYLVAIAKPSTELACEYSPSYPSVASLSELIF